MKHAEQIIQAPCAVAFFADSVSAVMKAGNVVHVIFTAREPQVCEEGKIYRSIQARMIVPVTCLAEIGRVIQDGQLTPHKSEYDDFSEPSLVH